MTFHTSPTFMDYLHGDVDEQEADFACAYEYARESMEMCGAAHYRDRLCREQGCDTKTAILRMCHQDRISSAVFGLGGIQFLECASFPLKDWNQLSRAERHAIMRHWETRQFPPLKLLDLCLPVSQRVFDRLKARAQAAEQPPEDLPPGKAPPPMKSAPAILNRGEVFGGKADWPTFYAVFEIDFAEGPKRVAERFAEWLREPANKERFAKFKVKARAKTDKPLERLKDLAAWRLYREMGNDFEKANLYADAHRKRFEAGKAVRLFKPGDPRPFLNARATPETKANETPLYANPENYREAKGRAIEHLREAYAEEFRVEPSWVKELDKLGKQAFEN